MKARITCQLCEWHYDIPPVNPLAADPMALASVFGVGVFAATAFSRQAENTEEALRAHLETHTLVEWVSKVTQLQSELDWLKKSFT